MKMKNTMKKVIGAALAGTMIFASATTLAGCTTSHPEVQMKISFNEKTYTLEYKLYRKIAPATVQHFMDLVDAKYYDGLCVHDYDSTRWYTGGYEYDETKTDTFGGLVEKNYFDVAKTIKLSKTVWYDKAKNDPAYTLKGEFSSNGFQVKAGALRQSFGSLTMYYTPKTEVTAKVYAKRSDGKGEDLADYQYNSATSLFYIHVAANTSAASANYCTFASLDSGSKDDLQSLLDAISDYVADKQDGDDDYRFAKVVDEVPCDAGDKYVEDGVASYDVPQLPIIIQSVKVTKY
ncbi:MAG: peptidylprolyl isomerase [Clostridia bacterium]|nr:peptidylprolyl isomerase [Clostridia bacterium]